MRTHLRANHVAFWNRLIPTLLAHRADWLASRPWHESFGLITAVLWALAVLCVVLLVVIVVLGALLARNSKRRKMGAAVGGGAAGVGCKQSRL